MVLEKYPISYGDGGIIAKTDLELSLKEVRAKLGGAQNRPAVINAAAKTLKVAKFLWQPKIVYRWLEVSIVDEAGMKLCCAQSGQSVTLTMGFSTGFVKKATKALIGIYTVGKALEDAAVKASGEGRVLDGYMYDIIGLAVLDRLKIEVSRIAEEYCKKQNWGVSPFLSPGSVHGWELEDQPVLCSMLPLGMIDVAIQENCILLPFKSISFLIGTGPGYQVTAIGTTCEVCSKRDNCQTRIEE